MQIKKVFLPYLVISLIICLMAPSPLEAKSKKPAIKPEMNRLMVNGKVVMDTHYAGKLLKKAQKHFGQTIVILPRSSSAVIWKQSQPLKQVKAKMLSLVVNGKTIVDSKVASIILLAAKKNIGKRLVIKLQSKPMPVYSPSRMNVILTGPYSKKVLQDYQKVLVAQWHIINKHEKNKLVKEWADSKAQYYRYQNGMVISFSLKGNKSKKFRAIHEVNKSALGLTLDKYYHSTTGDFYLLLGIKISKKKVNETYIITMKSGKELYELAYKGLTA